MLLAAVVLGALLMAAGCGDDAATSAKPGSAPVAQVTPSKLTAKPDASMWDDGTAACKFTGKAAAEVAGGKAASEGVDGVIEFDDQSQDHVQGCVDYPVSPPVGGAHNPIWSNCGFYTSAVPNEHAVHDLEHGAVWIAFGTDIDQATLDTIRAAAGKSTHILASPYPGLGSRIVLGAWGRQLTLDSVGDPRFEQFIDTYVQEPQTPELGASCDRAMGTPTR